MNIFYLSHDVNKCAEWSVDSHCIKMILETAQLLSTAHRILDGVQTSGLTASGRKKKVWVLPDHRNDILYSATHVNHPSAVWCRETLGNYIWLREMLVAYCREYTYRYGKTHKVEADGLLKQLMIAPQNIDFVEDFTPPPSCMDAKYIISKDAVENYRNYYKVGKAHLHKWKNRQPPAWIME